jgi:hypothetical protein
MGLGLKLPNEYQYEFGKAYSKECSRNHNRKISFGLTAETVNINLSCQRQAKIENLENLFMKKITTVRMQATKYSGFQWKKCFIRRS